MNDRWKHPKTRVSSVRLRFWAECVVLLITMTLWVITITEPDWVERLLPGVAPDGGDGSLEWSMVAVGLLVILVLAVAAFAEWRRPRTDTSAAAKTTR